MDLDHFKSINDTRGHAAGDAALVALADVCRRELRTSDLLGRIGGEEFVVLLLETALPEALDAAERLRARIASAQVVYDGAAFGMTASLGVSSWPPEDSLDALLHQADQAMYQAKTGGRDRVVAARGDGT
jgi:diguanylate cyclase (GGDEF)-like protein